MYAVVGCNNCNTMWLLRDPRDANTATCPRCGKRHQTKKLKRFFKSEDRAAAQEARAALLAKKHGDSEAFADVAHTAELARQVENAGVSDREYLEGAGLNADEIESAGDQATGSKSRDELVREAIKRAGDDRPTESEVVAYAVDRGVPREAAKKLLDRLVRSGEATESGGRYRLL